MAVSPLPDFSPEPFPSPYMSLTPDAVFNQASTIAWTELQAVVAGIFGMAALAFLVRSLVKR